MYIHFGRTKVAVEKMKWFDRTVLDSFFYVYFAKMDIHTYIHTNIHTYVALPVYIVKGIYEINNVLSNIT
jgi:hypothetical protein